jgi:hypothetical protein
MKTVKIVLLALISTILSVSLVAAGLDFDVSKPYGTATVSSLPGYIRETRSDMFDFGTMEHNKDGTHKIPSATPSGLSGLTPSPGRLVYNNATGALLYGTGTTWVGTNGAINVPYAMIANYSGDLTAALGIIGSTPTRLVIDTPATISASTVVPKNVTLEFSGAGQVTLGNYNLTLNCEVRAPPIKIFNYNGAGVVIKGASGPDYMIADWFGAIGDGITNDRVAILNALLAQGSAPGSVQFVNGQTYVISGVETTIPANVTLQFLAGSKISLVNHNLIMSGSYISVPLKQCFAITGSGIVKRSEGGKDVVTPEDFGGTGVGNISAAFSYCDDYPAHVVFTTGTYGVSTSLTSGSNVTLDVKAQASIVVTSPATLTVNGRIQTESLTTAWWSGTGAVNLSTTTFSGLSGTYTLPKGSYTLPADTLVPDTCTLELRDGALLNIPTTKTLTINGLFIAGANQVFACVGTGTVAFGFPHKINELNARWWGATGLGAVDDQPAIQKMVDCSLASHSLNMYLPAGTYKILDTIKLGYGDGRWFHGTFRGDNSKDVYGTVIDAAGFGDRPAINFQGAYRARATDLYIKGKNLAPGTMTGSPPSFKPLVTDWVSAGCNNYRYAPYAGIAIDAYCGTAPVGGAGNEPYPNDVYGRQYSNGVILERIWVDSFVAGIVLKPCIPEDQCDTFSARDCWIERCAYGFSSGGSQNRDLQMYNPMIDFCWVALTNSRHGAQDGNIPSIHGGMIQQGWKLMERGGVENAHVISGLHTENLVWIGEIGLSPPAWSRPTIFVGCEFGRTTSNPWLSPFWVIANESAVFNGCSLFEHQATAQSYLLNIGGQGKATFNACGFARADEPTAATIYMGGYVPYGFNLTSFRDCATEVFTGFPNPNREMYVNSLAGSARWLIGHGMVRIYDANLGNSYKVNRLNQYGYASASFVEVLPTISGTAVGSTMTFTATNVADFKLGDIILWKVKWPEHTASSDTVPVFKVTDITGDVITSTALFDNFDATYNPSQWVKIATPYFVNGTESTGDTHTDTTVDNVTTIANWAIGDWIRGAGIPDNTRIVNIVGTTITLSNAATASATGVALYNCRLVAY